MIEEKICTFWSYFQGMVEPSYHAGRAHYHTGGPFGHATQLSSVICEVTPWQKRPVEKAACMKIRLSHLLGSTSISRLSWPAPSLVAFLASFHHFLPELQQNLHCWKDGAGSSQLSRGIDKEHLGAVCLTEYSRTSLKVHVQAFSKGESTTSFSNQFHWSLTQYWICLWLITTNDWQIDWFIWKIYILPFLCWCIMPDHRLVARSQSCASSECRMVNCLTKPGGAWKKGRG